MKIQKSMVRNRRVYADTDVAEEASELLFEAKDVAELISQVSGEDVEVTTDDGIVEFGVGDETYTCEAEPGDETVEGSARMRTVRRVSASTGRRSPARRVSASAVCSSPARRGSVSTTRVPAGRTVRRVPRRR